MMVVSHFFFFSLFVFSPLQASRNWLMDACNSNYVNDSALFPDSWDGTGLEGGIFLSKCLSQTHSTQGAEFTHVAPVYSVLQR